MRAPHEIMNLQYFKTSKPKLVYLGEDPWGDECFVPAGWLNKWLDLPEGGADHREGKAWWYDLPEEQVATSYHAWNCDGDLHVNVQVHSQPASMRQVVIPIFRLRHWLKVETTLVNAAPNNCFVPLSWLVEWLRLSEGEQDERLGKSWGFMPPNDNEEMIYRAKRIGGYLIVEVESPSDPSMNRMAVKALADFHLREDG